MASSAARRQTGRTVAEHDVVRLLRALDSDEGTIPADEKGTVVYIHRGGEAFEIEFDAPFHVMTVVAGDVERVAG